jgi:PAS domain S-box-containing protein
MRSTNSAKPAKDDPSARRAALLDSQRHVLERIGTGAPLEDVLLTLVRLIEDQTEMRCAVLLADIAQTRLQFVAAPHLPHDYCLAVEPYLAIALELTTCGTAASSKQPVYARDIASDPQWEKIRDIALRSHLRALWSTPILSDDDRVLGTFAMYYDRPRLPDDEDMRLIDTAVQMARVAIEAKADDDLLRLTFDHAPAAIVITDLEGRVFRANDALARILGYAPADLRGIPLSDIAEGDDHAALVKKLKEGAAEVSSDRRYRVRGGSWRWARQHATLRRIAGGERYVVIFVDALGDDHEHPLQRLSERERQVLELVVAGRTSKEIAARLHLAPSSVDTYRSRVMQKLGIDDVPGLVRFAIRLGITTA